MAVSPGIANANMPSQSECNNDREEFARTVENLSTDGKISPKEADALIAHKYGDVLPCRTPARMTTNALLRDQLIGKATSELIEKIRQNDPELLADNSPGEPAVGGIVSAGGHFGSNEQRLRNLLLDQETERLENINERSAAGNAMYIRRNGKITPTPHGNHENEVMSLAKFVDKFNSRNNPAGGNKTGLPKGDAGVVSMGATETVGGIALVDADLSGKKSADSVVHEAMHQYAHQNIRSLPAPLNEGMTEYFSKSAMANTGNLSGIEKNGNIYGVSYLGATREAFRLSGIVGEETMKKAYFAGDVNGLKKAFEARIGKGSWTGYLEIMRRNDDRAKPGTANFRNDVNRFLNGRLHNAPLDKRAGIQHAIDDGEIGIIRYRAILDEAATRQPLGIDI